MDFFGFNDMPTTEIISTLCAAFVGGAFAFWVGWIAGSGAPTPRNKSIGRMFLSVALLATALVIFMPPPERMILSNTLPALLGMALGAWRRRWLALHPPSGKEV